MNEDRAVRYHRLRRRATVVSMAAGASWLAALPAFGWSLDLAAWARGLAPGLPWHLDGVVAVAAFGAVLSAGWELASCPFRFYGSFVLDRKYGLSSEPFATWAGDHLKGAALGLSFSIGAAVAVYAAMVLSPVRWWLLATLGFVAAASAVSQIAPVVLMPMFYRFRPLDRNALTERLLALSDRAGVPVLGVFEWGLGGKTSRANAALVGAGRTRRILVSDTLLKDYSDDEIEVILAHELAHHIHHDMWSALAVETIIVGAALFAAGAAAARAGSAPANLATWPVMLLAGGAVSLLLRPAANAWSRRNERLADRCALSLTGRSAPFISAMRRLAAQNLAEERPSPPVFWFFHTHPTIDERIAAARRVSAA